MRTGLHELLEPPLFYSQATPSKLVALERVHPEVRRLLVLPVHEMWNEWVLPYARPVHEPTALHLLLACPLRRWKQVRKRPSSAWDLDERTDAREWLRGGGRFRWA